MVTVKVRERPGSVRTQHRVTPPSSRADASGLTSGDGGDVCLWGEGDTSQVDLEVCEDVPPLTGGGAMRLWQDTFKVTVT